jgi:hypothetical protein
MEKNNKTGRCSRCFKIKEIVYTLGKHINFCLECKRALGLRDEPPELKNTAIRGESYINRKRSKGILVKNLS